MSEFADKVRSLGVLGGGRTRDRVVETRNDDGSRLKATTDQLGHTVTQTSKPLRPSADTQDVLIRAPRVVLRAGEAAHD